jgi:hypothetical protein
VPLKSTRHHNTGTGHKEVKEEPMAMMRVQEKQHKFFCFFTEYPIVCSRRKATKRESQEKEQQKPVVLFFSFSFTIQT